MNVFIFRSLTLLVRFISLFSPFDAVGQVISLFSLSVLQTSRHVHALPVPLPPDHRGTLVQPRPAVCGRDGAAPAGAAAPDLGQFLLLLHLLLLLLSMPLPPLLLVFILLVLLLV